MDATKCETVRTRLEGHRQFLQRKLARVEGQIVQVQEQVKAIQRRIDGLTAGQRWVA